MCSGGRGKGGQVFELTRFNEGCACVCACMCAHSCLLLRVRRFHGERTSRDMGARMEVAALIVRSGFFIQYLLRESKKTKKFPSSPRPSVFKPPPRTRGEESAPSGTSD